MEISLATTGGTNKEYITSDTNLGYSKQKQSNYTKALEHFRLALRHTSHPDGSIHINQIEAIINLANTFLPAARYDSCEYYLLETRRGINPQCNKDNGCRSCYPCSFRKFYFFINKNNHMTRTVV